MPDYNATVELSRELAADEADWVIEKVDGRGVVVTTSLRRRAQVILTVSALDLRSATKLALMDVEDALVNDLKTVSVQVMPTNEFDESGGMIDEPGAFLSVTEAAERLGSSPQNIRARIKRGSIPAARLGSQWIVPAAAVSND
ncbi:helix-turn-helix domain-containing protein [Nesterenkonia sp. MY13]|uniref:Helix-turn-helix domain-containing protein n=1 Tax=Nesterenkonia sedimenti TaxID=1463632 RepID=A0A7X8TJW5_9MICC|nr:helix-turn-helix domain-containing protein [Nesterenkonia sedimenti]NLS09870.1 helix-turn-helix domain-containing protein [Nesterenkonia sedimenti]